MKKEKTDLMTEIREDMEIEKDEPNTVNNYYDLYHEMNKDYKKVRHNYDNNRLLDNLHDDSDEYILLNNGLFSHYISDNISDYVTKFNEQIENIEIHYINKN